METMALYQETAYEKLYRWAQGKHRVLFTRKTNDVLKARIYLHLKVKLAHEDI